MSMLTNIELIEIYQGAIKKIQQGWCQHHGARDQRGNYCSPKGFDAVQWCLLGAIEAATIPLVSSNPNYGKGLEFWSATREPLITTLTMKLGQPRLSLASGVSLSKWNDLPERLPEDVVDLFQQTILRLEVPCGPT